MIHSKFAANWVFKVQKSSGNTTNWRPRSSSSSARDFSFRSLARARRTLLATTPAIWLVALKIFLNIFWKYFWIYSENISEYSLKIFLNIFWKYFWIFSENISEYFLKIFLAEKDWGGLSETTIRTRYGKGTPQEVDKNHSTQMKRKFICTKLESLPFRIFLFVSLD